MSYPGYSPEGDPSRAGVRCSNQENHGFCAIHRSKQDGNMSILPECIAVMQSDFRLSNAPEKVKEIHEFEDIISTDHKLISFTLDFDIAKKLRSSAMSLTTRADWNALNEALIQISP